MAAKGWLVFQPNYRGSDNLGNAYANAIRNDAGEGPGKDVMAGIEAAEEARHRRHRSDGRVGLVLRRLHDHVDARALRHLEGRRHRRVGHESARSVQPERRRRRRPRQQLTVDESRT